MRIEVPREFDRLGAVRTYGLQKIYELDAGAEAEIPGRDDAVVRSLPAEALYGVQREMAIVVPVKSERLKLIEGVLVGIPNSCLVIVVSNSPREPARPFLPRTGIHRQFLPLHPQTSAHRAPARPCDRRRVCRGRLSRTPRRHRLKPKIVE